MRELFIETEDLKYIFDSINKHEQMMNSLEISQEGIGMIASRIFHKYVDEIYRSIIDTFNGIFTLLNVGGVLDKITYYSPLEDKFKVNKFTLFKVLNDNNPRYLSLDVPKPMGMIASYHEVFRNNHAIFDSLDMSKFIDIVKHGVTALTDILEDEVSSVQDYERTLASTVAETIFRREHLKTLSKIHEKQFSGDKTKEQTVRFEKEFTDVKGFEAFCKLMMKDFKEIIKIGGVKKAVVEQGELFRKMVAALEKRDDLTTKKNLKMMIDYCDFVTSVYQLFGALCLTQIAMETNLCIVIDEMTKLYYQTIK